jgi:hypothetical protein
MNTDRRGVVRRDKLPTPVEGNGERLGRASPEPTRNEYLAFALANKRKPWARRWLREHYMGRFL